MIAGLQLWMEDKGYETCIECGHCYAACEDTSHQVAEDALLVEHHEDVPVADRDRLAL